jgi:hypothetical protein
MFGIYFGDPAATPAGQTAISTKRSQRLETIEIKRLLSSKRICL